MAENLIRAKIKEALMATGNNRHDAHKLLLTWAIRDPALLLAMTKPHLKAISAGLVDHYVRQRSDGAADDGPDNLPRAAIDDIVASAAVHLPMDDRKGSKIPPPKETERQADTMRKLAAAFTRNKKKTD